MLLLASTAPCEAQAPNPLAPRNDKLRTIQSNILDDLQKKNFEKVDAAKFDAYFNDYFLLQFADPQFADPEAKPPRTLADLRRVLRRTYFGNGKSGPPYDRLHDLTFAMMKAIIATKFPDDPETKAQYEAVKYNAMVVIGELNEQEAAGVPGSKDKPSGVALEFMRRVVNIPKAPEYLRVPALLGIERQARCFDVNPPPQPVLDQLIKDMIALLGQTEPPANRSPAAQAWLRRMAAQILGAIQLPGSGGGDDAVKALATVIRERSNPLSLRCAAAAAFTDMRFNAQSKVDTAAIAKDIGALALELVKTEADYAESKHVEPNRRRLRYALTNVAFGLIGRDKRHGVMAVVPAAVNAPDADAAIKSQLLALLKVAGQDGAGSKDLLNAGEGLRKAMQQLNLRVAWPTPAPSGGQRTESPPTSPRSPSAPETPLAENK